MMFRPRLALLTLLLANADAVAQNRLPGELGAAELDGDSLIEFYAEGELTFGELRVPEGPGPQPVAILVHGSQYRAVIPGLPPEAASFKYMRPVAASLTAAGIATWNIEYRRVGHEGGGWPNTFLDVADGADHLRALAERHNLDLSRIIALGHSSGGHLAFWLAARKKLLATSDLYRPEPLELSGTINLDGPLDIGQLARGAAASEEGLALVNQLMGGTPDQRPERYEETSPIELLPLGVEQALFAVKSPAAYQAVPYLESAVSLGDTIEIYVVADGGHFIFLDPLNDEWRDVFDTVRRMLSMTP